MRKMLQAVSSVIGDSCNHYSNPMTAEGWNDDIAYAMTPFKLLLWPMGNWPLQVYNVYSLLRCVTVTFGMSTVVILPFIEICLGCTDADQNIDALMIIFCGLLAMTKMIWSRIYATNLIETYKYAVNDYLTVKNAEQRVIMLRHAFIGRTLMCTIVCLSYIDSLGYSLTSIIRTLSKKQINGTLIRLEYTLPSTCILEYFNVPRSMYLTNCVIELIMMLFVCTGNFGNDSLFLHMVLHICGQVKILKSRFTNFDFTAPRIHDRFNALIQRHSHLVERSKILADAISFILLVQLFLSSLLLCILGFQIILALKKNDSAVMLRSFMVLNAFLSQITMYCVIGDYLKTQMEEISIFIYQTTWYNLPVKLTKNLTFLIMRSQTPVQLQAGNFIVVNLETYMSILKTSVSYLSVLRVMVET